MTAQHIEEVQPGSRSLNEEADVRFTSRGAPLALRWRASIWQVLGEPMHWTSSRSWWEPGQAGKMGQGSVMTLQYWRFRAQTGPASPILVFDICSDPRWEGWRLVRITNLGAG
ncbi:DUF6504 family protein [Arthrobacter sp.]|uniref:DUF6504 family protein n=1 Tax=Arthrobacter sp. TaxID=1667 RepID=UPI002810AFA6|nr:DUF6504 family protein [Arthrobacter sp.]